MVRAAPSTKPRWAPSSWHRMTGAPIGAFHLEPQHAWKMRSWDQFLVPKPFTRICVSWAQWTHVPSDLAPEEFEPKRAGAERGHRARAAASPGVFRKECRMSETARCRLRLPSTRGTDCATAACRTRRRAACSWWIAASGALRDATVSASFLRFCVPGDLLVLNESRVIPARLYARRTVVRGPARADRTD